MSKLHKAEKGKFWNGVKKDKGDKALAYAHRLLSIRPDPDITATSGTANSIMPARVVTVAAP